MRAPSRRSRPVPANVDVRSRFGRDDTGRDHRSRTRLRQRRLCRQEGVPLRLMVLRRDDTCAICAISVASGTKAWWDSNARTVTCTGCASGAVPPAEPVEAIEVADSPDPPAVNEPGVAGASARREYDKRHQVREDKVRAAHPKIGGFLLAVTEEPQSIKAWDKGADGEQHVGRLLDRLATEGKIRALHDRRVPGSRGNIDHIAITPTGIVVIDAKNYTGRVEQRTTGSIFKPGPMKLYVNRRDRSTVIAGVHKQIEVISRAVGPIVGSQDVKVTGMLCFTQADFALFARPFTIDGVSVHWPRSMIKAVTAAGDLTLGAMEEIAARLGETLRPA